MLSNCFCNFDCCKIVATIKWMLQADRFLQENEISAVIYFGTRDTNFIGKKTLRSLLHAIDLINERSALGIVNLVTVMECWTCVV